jgi:hypothetical protein
VQEKLLVSFVLIINGVALFFLEKIRKRVISNQIGFRKVIQMDKKYSVIDIIQYEMDSFVKKLIHRESGWLLVMKSHPRFGR